MPNAIRLTLLKDEGVAIQGCPAGLAVKEREKHSPGIDGVQGGGGTEGLSKGEQRPHRHKADEKRERTLGGTLTKKTQGEKARRGIKPGGQKRGKEGVKKGRET